MIRRRFTTTSGLRVQAMWVRESSAIDFYDIEVVDADGEVVAYFQSQSSGAIDALARSHRWREVEVTR